MSLQVSPKGAVKLHNLLSSQSKKSPTNSKRSNFRRTLSSPFVGTGSGPGKPRAKEKIINSYKLNDSKNDQEDLDSVSTLELFRYASARELLATLCGIIFMWYAATWQPISVYNLTVMASIMGSYVKQTSSILMNYESNQTVQKNLMNSSIEAQYSDERAALRMLEPICVLLRPIFDRFMSAHSEATATNSTTSNLDPNLTASEMLDNESTRFLRQSFELNGAAFSLATTQATAFFVGLNMITWSARSQAARIKILYLRSCLMQEAAWFEGKSSASGSASSLSALVDKFEDGIGPKLALLVYFLGHVGIFALSAFLQHFKLAATCMPYVLIVGMAIGILSEWQATAIGRENRLSKLCHQVGEEIVSSVRTIFAFSGERKELARYKSSLKPVFKSSLTKHLYTALNISLSKFSVFACFAAYCYHAMQLFPPYDKQGPGSKAIVLGVMRGAEVSIVNILISIPFIEALQQARGSIARIFAVIERRSAVDPSSGAGESLQPGQWEPSLSFKNVQFSYKSNSKGKNYAPILQQLNLEIKGNQSLALVGPSGSGKSTILALIQRFYQPTEGQILLDGHDISTLNVSWWRNQIALVSQEPRLFDMTIEENIRLGLAAHQVNSLTEDVIKQEVRLAAKAANADDFIKRLPNKYKTRVGPAGVQLSGGQKQRIAIARALIRKPKLLLLDEPTSALDSESETKVQEAIRIASRNRTTITVAHRLATVRHMDKIIVLHQGQVVESGNHRALMALRTNGLYRQMYKQQEQEQELEQELEEAEEELENTRECGDEDTDTGKHNLGASLECLEEPDPEINSKADSRLELSHKGYKLPKFCLTWKFLQLPTWTTLFAIIVCLLAGLIMPVNLIAHSYLFRSFADEGLEKIGEDLRVFGIFILSLSAFVFIISFLQVLLPGYVGEIISKRLRAKIMDSLLQKPMSYYDMDENSAGALCGRFNSHVSNVQNIAGSRIAIILEAITTLSFGLGYGFCQNISLSLFCFTFALMVLSTTIIESHLVHRENLVLNKLDNKLSHLIGEALSNMRIINSLNKEQFFVDKFTDIINRRELGLGFRVSLMRSLLTSLKFIMPAMGWSASMFYGSTLLTSGRINVQTIFIVCPVVLFAVNDTFRALVFLPELVKAYQSIKSLFFMHEEYMSKDLQTLHVEPPQDILKSKEAECIEFKDVCFSYPSRPSILALNKISFNVKSGQSIALVGSSGSGKSTCAAILQKFYSYQSGEVLFQGRDLRFSSTIDVRSQIGLVSQEPTLLTYTIGENIAYGDNRRVVPYDEILSAAKKANIHDFIMQLPERYDTLVGSQTSSEVKLSGGQKQRIAIARALVRNAPVMIFDEATSALDAPNELLVAEALKIARQNKTSITIAHRLATIKDVDRILVMQDGCLIESGSHEELLQKQEGLYKRLWESQQKRRMIKSETVNNK